MRKYTYTVMNLFLALACVGTTVWILHYQPSERSVETFRASNQLEKPNKDSYTLADISQPPPKSSSPGTKFEVLYKHSLFNSQREELGIESKPRKVSKQKRPVDMELIGVGAIGDKAAAVILVRNQRSTRNRNAESGEVRTRHVYRVGQMIRDTDYELTDITLSEVFLQKGEEKRVLRMQTSDKSSAARKTAAAREAEKVRQRKQAIADKDKVKPQRIPPLPGPMQEVAKVARKGDGRTSTKEQEKVLNKQTTISREERIQRALEARRRIIERRRKVQQRAEQQK